MNILDIVILLVIAALLVLAWRASRKKGGCSGNCAQCRKLCDSRDKKDK